MEDTYSTVSELESAIHRIIAEPGRGAVEDVGRLMKRLRKEVTLLQAYGYDQLTGLPTRRLAEDKITGLESTRKRVGDARSYSIVFIDLDGLKGTNDELGHDVGDILIESMGKSIRKSIRPMDFACRWGGDEFVIILDSPHPGSASESQVGRIKKLYKETVSFDYSLGPNTGASFGTAIVQDGEPIHSTISRADYQMYREKRDKGVRNGVR